MNLCKEQNLCFEELVIILLKSNIRQDGKLDILENPNRANIGPKLAYSIDLINKMDKYIRDAKVELKCKLINSIFPKKVAFDGKAYRTNSMNKVLDLIYQQTNELQGKKNGKDSNNSSFSHLVSLTVLFSNQFLEDLDLIYELKEWIPKP